MSYQPGHQAYYEQYWGLAAESFAVVPPVTARLIASHLAPGRTCLDVGCGRGTAGLLIQSCGCRYVGLDVSSGAVSAARVRGLDAVAVAHGESLPFAQEVFDAAVCLDVVEHLFAPQQMVAEVFRVLKPGGKLILTTPNVAYWRRRLDLALLGRWNPLGYEAAVERPWADPHIRFFNPGALRRLLETAGFAQIRIGGHGGSVLGDMPWFGHRFAPADSNPAQARPPFRREGPARSLYRRLEEAVPSILGCFLHAVAHKRAPSE